MFETTIRVHYPLQAGRIAIRTDTDWNSNIEATKTSEDKHVATFKVAHVEAFFYYKPVIIDGDRTTWTQGNNYLASMSASDGIDIYPAFHSDLNGEVIGPFDVAGGPLGAHPIRIYLPPGYHENTLKRYPVLYMHDGKNLFFPEDAFMGQEWQVDETMDLLNSFNLIDKCIVVGVYAGDRMADYTQPGYEAYGRFLAEVLKVEVDSALRTLPGPRQTAVMGSSLGGVVSLFLAWQWSQVFGMAACLSSTFTWKDDLATRIATESMRDVRLYLDSGWPGDNYEATRLMKDLLLTAGFEPGLNLTYFTWPLAAHNESDWALRLHVPFQFFFGKMKRA